MPLKDRYPANGSSRKGLPRKVAQAAAKKSWQNRDLSNWRDRVGDLLKGKQILVKDLREFNALYVAARRKGVQTCRFKLSNRGASSTSAEIYSKPPSERLLRVIFHRKTAKMGIWTPRLLREITGIP
jgi:hypothetical protein